MTHRLTTLALLCTMLCGCVSKTFIMKVELPPETPARVDVRGRRPSLRVDNLGGGTLTVLVEARDGSEREVVILPWESTETGPVHGPVSVWLTATEGGVLARVVVESARGVVLDQSPAAR